MNKAQIVQFLYDWWPALLLGLVAYQGIRYLTRALGRKPALQGIAQDVHQVMTTLACSEHQAHRLLSTYNGNAAKAINDVKTGRAVLPGAEFKELAQYVGDVKSFLLESPEFGIITRNDQQFLLDPQAPGLLILGVVNPEARPGLGRADRGDLYAQLFWPENDQWLRFLLEARRLDYFSLGERKQNAAFRNFRTVLEDLIARTPNLKLDPSVESFLSEVQTPVYKKLADLDSYAAQTLQFQSARR